MEKSVLQNLLVAEGTAKLSIMKNLTSLALLVKNLGVANMDTNVVVSKKFLKAAISFDRCADTEIAYKDYTQKQRRDSKANIISFLSVRLEKLIQKR